MPRPTRQLGILLTIATVGFAGALAPQLAARQTMATGTTTIDPLIQAGLKWRSVGPTDRAGRSIAISGVKGRPNEGYVGQVGGGLWKTTDKGETWTPVTDGQIHSSSVGAVAVSESNPDIVWIGMGESCIRGNIMSGDGLYRSTDAGKTWTHMGFEDVPVISKIRIHPTNPDIMYVAAFGKLSAPSDKRGVFKSTDGGKTWKKTLFRDGKTAAIDISIDPKNPNVMFAAMWEAYRYEYQMSSGGPGSGLFKSTDAGETWTEITRNPGMPSGMIGRIGVAVSGADGNRVYAVVENSANGGLFSSDNGGATWTLVNGGRNIRQRAFYYTHVTADPHNKDLVYVLNVGTFKSTDGGKTLASYVGGDSHELWIDPDDSNHILHANDSGGAVTLNGGTAWTTRDYPTAQYYHVAATRHLPYHVCGAQQDGSTVCVSSATGLAPTGGGGRGGRGGGNAVPAPYGIGGAEPGYIAPDPKDPDTFFSGGNNGSWLERLNRRTGESREVGPYPMIYSGQPSSDLKERIQWTFPIIFSPVDPKVLYAATQHVWKSSSQGDSWARISGDLTRHDPKTLGVSGGPITGDMNGPEVYATVFAIGPGKTDVNVIWAGSDDGLINVTRDGGKTWVNVTPKDMPDFGRVSIIDASKFEPGGAYVAVKRPLLDDFAPYIFRTKDFGKTWTKIVTGIPGNDYVHTVREDTVRKGLLFAGTQHGAHVSFDDGDHWQSLQLNLPDAPIADLVIERNDLAIATHGRGFYILDNIGPLRQAGTAMSGDVVLLKPNNAIRSYGGATLQYILRKPAQLVTIDIIDSKGRVARTLTSAPNAAPPADGRAGGGGGRGGGGFAAPLALTTGTLNTTTWDLRYPNAVGFPGLIMWGASLNGPAAAPGTYTVKLTVDGQSTTQPLIVERHPLYQATDADLQAQFDFLIQVRDKVTETNNAVIKIRDIKTQIANRLGKTTDTKLKTAADMFVEGIGTIESNLYQVKNQSGQDPLNFPIKLNNQIASVLSMVGNGDGRPTAEAPKIYEMLSAEIKVQLDKLNAILAKDLPAINAELTRLGLENIK